jgi:hypothetical protein
VVLRIPTTEYGRLSAVLPAGYICYMGTGRPAKVTRPTGMHWMAEIYLFKPKLPVEAGDAERYIGDEGERCIAGADRRDLD